MKSYGLKDVDKYKCDWLNEDARVCVCSVPSESRVHSAKCILRFYRALAVRKQQNKSCQEMGKMLQTRNGGMQSDQMCICRRRRRKKTTKNKCWCAASIQTNKWRITQSLFQLSAHNFSTHISTEKKNVWIFTKWWCFMEFHCIRNLFVF